MMDSEFLQPDNTIDIVSSSTLADYELFFGPITEGAKSLVIEAKRISDVLVTLKLATSKTWCKKNNWDWELKPGFTYIKFGMKKVTLYIYVERVSDE